MTVIQLLSQLIAQYKREESGGAKFLYPNGLDAESRILDICKNTLPSGSGIDCGTKFCFERSSQSKIVLFCEYHHLNNAGYYDGWTAHYITVRPDFDGIRLYISGRDRNQIKDYLADVYNNVLTSNAEN